MHDFLVSNILTHQKNTTRQFNNLSINKTTGKHNITQVFAGIKDIPQEVKRTTLLFFAFHALKMNVSSIVEDFKVNDEATLIQ